MGKPPDLIFQQALRKEHVSVALAKALETPTLPGREKIWLPLLNILFLEEKYGTQSDGH